MLREIKFALYAIKKNIQSSAELRTSFLMTIVGMALNNTSFIILWVFFAQAVGTINGWTAIDVVGLQGFSTISFGLVMSAGIGIRKIADYVVQGTFDRFMLSPKDLLLRTATSSFNTAALGDILSGAVCLVIFALGIHASMAQLGLIVFLIFIATLMSLAVILVIFSTSFFFPNNPSTISNGLFELFLTPSLFHGGAIQGALRFVLTFIVPALAVGALPVEVVRSISLEKILSLTALAIVWFLFSVWYFNRAVRRYESANFMTFGG